MRLCDWRPLVSSGRGTECAQACPGSLSAAGALPAREQTSSWQWAALLAVVPGQDTTEFAVTPVVSPQLPSGGFCAE